MPTCYRLTARLVALTHWSWVIVFFLGFFVQFLSPGFAPIETAALTLSLGCIKCWGGKCPLTVLENVLRVRSGTMNVYQGAFIAHGLAPTGVRIPPGRIGNTMIVMLAISAWFWAFREISRLFSA